MLPRRDIHIFREVPALRQHRRGLLLSGETVGLVPTMGALHAGHLSLVRRAAAENSKVFVTIYVNPAQFAPHEDLDAYPKTWESDLAQLERLDAELAGTKHGGGGRIEAVFAPTTKTMYPTLPPDNTLPGTGSFVTITPLASALEGSMRPVFFRGVTTVCMKLFNIVQAERAYFGQKDAQQCVVLKRLVRDFHVDTEVRVVPTEREPDGLAMSSRNVYLGARRRRVGLVVSRALRRAEEAYRRGERRADRILAEAWEIIRVTQEQQRELGELERVAFDVDYLSLVDPTTLMEVEGEEGVDERRGALLTIAIRMSALERTTEGEQLGVGGDRSPVRLIDNVMLGGEGVV